MLMKIKFFNKIIALTPIESEALKVALLDALTYTENQRAVIDPNSREIAPVVTKIARLEALIKKMGIS